MQRLELIQIGNPALNELGLILPKEIEAHLGVDQNSILYLTETPDGFLLTTNDPS